VVAGIGINLARVPSKAELESDRPALTPTSLAEHASAVPSIRTLSGLLARRVLDLLDSANAVAVALEAFNGRDALRDRKVLTEEYGAGIARGIDRDGMLLLELDDSSVVSVRSGSVRPVPMSGLEE
jgi:biotin-(acetyl-CoA carboxylase) ligase